MIIFVLRFKTIWLVFYSPMMTFSWSSRSTWMFCQSCQQSSVKLSSNRLDRLGLPRQSPNCRHFLCTSRSNIFHRWRISFIHLHLFIINNQNKTIVQFPWLNFIFARQNVPDKKHEKAKQKQIFDRYCFDLDDVYTVNNLVCYLSDRHLTLFIARVLGLQITFSVRQARSRAK